MAQTLNRRKPRAGQAGFSLLEMLVALAILSAAAYVALDTVDSDTGQTRYQITENRLEKIRKAIVGNPDLVLNGSPVVSGFIADVGTVPRCLDALVTQDPDCNANGVNDSDASEVTPVAAPVDFGQVASTGVWVGWRGPYLTTDSNGIRDGWGAPDIAGENNWGWSVDMTGPITVTSFGRDRAVNGAADTYDADQDMAPIDTADYQVDLASAQVTFNATNVASDTQVCMAIVTADPSGTDGWSLLYTTTTPPTFLTGVPDSAQFDFSGDVMIGTRKLIAYDANALDGGTPVVDTSDCTPATGYSKADILSFAILGSKGLVFAPKVTPIANLSLALP